MKNYTPKPIDTSHVAVPAELAELVELLAENTHDHWAARRLAEGWTWGAARNDEKREHPDLVAYGELTEGEKQYDRTTAMEALKAIIALGFEIRRR